MEENQRRSTKQAGSTGDKAWREGNKAVNGYLTKVKHLSRYWRIERLKIPTQTIWTTGKVKKKRQKQRNLNWRVNRALESSPCKFATEVLNDLLHHDSSMQIWLVTSARAAHTGIIPQDCGFQRYLCLGTKQRKSLSCLWQAHSSPATRPWSLGRLAQSLTAQVKPEHRNPFPYTPHTNFSKAGHVLKQPASPSERCGRGTRQPAAAQVCAGRKPSSRGGCSPSGAAWAKGMSTFCPRSVRIQGFITHQFITRGDSALPLIKY